MASTAVTAAATGNHIRGRKRRIFPRGAVFSRSASIPEAMLKLTRQAAHPIE